MYSLSKLNSEFRALFTSYFQEQPLAVTPLPASGSTRQYYRIQSESHSAIAAFNPNIAENKSFIYFAKHFGEAGLNVPAVFAMNEAGDCYLQTDLGTSSLFDKVMQSWQSGRFQAELIPLYKKAVEHLVDFQLKGHEGLDYNKAWPVSAFDKQAVMDDLLYFKYYFLKPHSLGINEFKLQQDFEKLAGFIQQAPADFFMYRDFQSRNIMLQQDKMFFIDFQGGRRGPLQYDLISLLYQAKARIPETARDEIKRHYMSQLARRLDVEKLQFDDFFTAFVYLRLMQVLGAYGFRGLIQKKPHFLESIPYALQEMEHLSQKQTLPLVLPELELAFAQLTSLKKTYPLRETNQSKGLRIHVNSFSYLKTGVPHDESGNGGGHIFDCRALPNPGRIHAYKMLSGQDKAVRDYLEAQPALEDFMKPTLEIITQSIQNYVERGFSSLMVSFGCTGGQHRSVYCAEKTAAFLRNKYPELKVILNHMQLHQQ